MTKGYVCVECGSQIVGHSKADCDAGRAAMLFENWWDEEGRYLDPDTAEVSWFDKRKELAGFAYTAAALMRRIDAKKDEILQREREALERPLLAEIDSLQVVVRALANCNPQDLEHVRALQRLAQKTHMSGAQTPQLESFTKQAVHAFSLLDKVRERIADCPHCFDVLAQKDRT